jgi:hypothetical protein
MAQLSPADADLFFRLYGALHLFVNGQFPILPDAHSIEDLAAVKLEDRAKLRDAVYDHAELIDRFVRENPAGLSAEELTEVKSWSQFIRGDFYILRHLKRYSVLLSSNNPARAYGVVGLTEPIADVFPDYVLPVYVQTVLLPFRGRIVWDGLANSYNITFGSGIRGNLNETYQRVKQREGITESLAAPGKTAAGLPAAARQRKAQTDLQPIVRDIVAAAARLHPGVTPIQSRAFGVLRAAAQLAETAATDPANLVAINEQIRALSRSYNQLIAAYEREAYED